MLKSAILLTLGRLGVLLLGAVQVCLITRLPEGVAGLILLHAGIYGALAVGIDFGTGQALLRLCCADSQRKMPGTFALSPRSQEFLRAGVVLRLRFALLATGAHILLTLALGQGSDLWLLLASTHLFSYALGATQTSFLLYQAPVPLLLARISGFTLSLCGTIILRLSTVETVGPYLLAQGLGHGLSNILLWRQSGLILTGPRSPLRFILKECHLLGLGTFIRFLYYHGDQLLVYLFAPHQLHLYSAPYRLFGVATLLPASLGDFLLGPLTRTSHEKTNSTVRSLSWKLTILGLLPLAVGFLFAQPILGILFGPPYKEADSILQILLVSALLVHPASVLITAALAAGKLKQILILSFAGLVTTTGLCLILVPRMGATGAAIATLGTELLILIGAFTISRPDSKKPEAR